ncbi:hypothetical protein [Nonomuraea dietziae]|uniref:hypothetical protein n=1 Tax=Nonomuraea dietziae TaxID=65515 RepID=UPI0031E22AAA
MYGIRARRSYWPLGCSLEGRALWYLDHSGIHHSDGGFVYDIADLYKHASPSDAYLATRL